MFSSGNLSVSSALGFLLAEGIRSSMGTCWNRASQI